MKVKSGKRAFPPFSLRLGIGKEVVPTRGKQGVGPHRGLKGLVRTSQVFPGFQGFGGNLFIGAVAGQVEPANCLAILMQNVVSPTQAEHDVEIARFSFMGNFQIFERILHVSGFHAALGHYLGIH
jgi:hypothetical protein